ncbi:hypothetical protein DFH06DRAFT_1335015 [Mycena polygramma]|nr:hypothetical protein DFH06DRAFT_1335015 [Mycena polygramma]
MSSPPQKPLLLPGIAPHLFPSSTQGRKARTTRTSESASRRAAEATVAAQAAEILRLKANISSLNASEEASARRYDVVQRKLLLALLHLAKLTALGTIDQESMKPALAEAERFLDKIKGNEAV